MFHEAYLNYFNNKKEIEKQKEILNQLYLEKDKLTQELELDEENIKCLTDEVQEAINIKNIALKELESVEEDTVKRTAENSKLVEENELLTIENNNLLKAIEENTLHSKTLLETYQQLLAFEGQNDKQKQLQELINSLDVSHIVRTQTERISTLNVEIRDLEQRYNGTKEELEQLKVEVEQLGAEKDSILTDIKTYTISNQHIFDFIKQGRTSEDGEVSIVPEELKYYDCYAEQKKLAEIIKVFVSIYKIKHMCDYECKEDDLIDFILIAGEKVPESKDILRQFVEYDLLYRDYNPHIHFLSSTNMKNHTIEEVLNKLFQDVSVSDLDGVSLKYKVHLGNDNYLADSEINMAVLSLHFYLNDVEITYESIKELGEIVLRRYRIHQIEQILIENDLQS